jgi:hypothetical protein
VSSQLLTGTLTVTRAMQGAYGTGHYGTGLYGVGDYQDQGLGALDQPHQPYTGFDPPSPAEPGDSP